MSSGQSPAVDRAKTRAIIKHLKKMRRLAKRWKAHPMIIEQYNQWIDRQSAYLVKITPIYPDDEEA